jgi:hypothetical protein
MAGQNHLEEIMPAVQIQILRAALFRLGFMILTCHDSVGPSIRLPPHLGTRPARTVHVGMVLHPNPHIESHLIMDSQQNAKRGDFGAGGTPGGIGTFFLGFAMACAGGWLLTNQVVISSDFFASGFMVPLVHYRMNSFGLALLPFIIGIGFLFFDGKSITGWLLTLAGLAIIFVGILMSLHIYFQPTSLFNTLAMLVLLFGGLGLVCRSLKAAPKEADKPNSAQP